MTHQPSRPYTFDRVVRILITVASIAAAVWIVNLLKNVLLPFLVSCLIAYLLEPFVQYNRSLLGLKGRIVAVFMTLFEAALLAGVLLYIFVPSIIGEMHHMADLLRRYSTSDVNIEYLPPALHDILRRNINFEEVAQMLMSQNIEAIVDKSLAVIQGGLSVVLGIVGWMIVFLYVVFIMIDYERLMRGFRLLVPPRFRNTAYKLGNDIKESMNHYFRGQALISCCVSVIYCVGFSLCGLPLAIIIGLGTAVLFMIPYCQYISIIPVTLLCLVTAADGTVDFWVMWLECMAVFTTVQIVGDFILMPRIMGHVMGLNPAIILLSLSVWGSLFGFVGMIIALPLTTLLLSYYEKYILSQSVDSDGGQDGVSRRKPRNFLRKFNSDSARQ